MLEMIFVRKQNSLGGCMQHFLKSRLPRLRIPEPVIFL